MLRFLSAILCTPVSNASFSTNELALSPAEIRPLLLSSKVPEIALKTRTGRPTTLQEQASGKPVILVFYRGGWCPFCNSQLSDLRFIQEYADALGYRLIGINPDLPKEVNCTLGKQKLNYTLLSDSKANAMRAFGIGYRLDAETIERYNGYGVDLEMLSGEKHQGLPVPSVFIVDANGILQFSYVNPDFRARIPGSLVLEAAKVIAERLHYLSPAE